MKLDVYLIIKSNKMKANELRIGNYIYNEIHGIGKVSAISGLDILYDRNYNSLNIELFKPIPLTEEWLLKFGFVLKRKNDYHIDLYVIELNKGTEDQLIISMGFKDKEWGMFNGVTDAWCNILNIKSIKYVHQLQNLYFSLTGEELIYS